MGAALVTANGHPRRARNARAGRPPLEWGHDLTRRGVALVLGAGLALAPACSGTLVAVPPSVTPTPTTPPATWPSVPGGRVLRRITAAEYAGSVRDALEVAPADAPPERPSYLGLRRVGASVGTLDTEEGVRAQARTMLLDPRARGGSRGSSAIRTWCTSSTSGATTRGRSS